MPNRGLATRLAAVPIHVPAGEGRKPTVQRIYLTVGPHRTISATTAAGHRIKRLSLISYTVP
jgi:hypothetical protein